MSETTIRQREKRQSPSASVIEQKPRDPIDADKTIEEEKLPTSFHEMMEKNLLSFVLSEFYFGYIFWSIFFGIGPMVMFFPMVKLAIDGYEILVLTLASPILLTFPLINHFAQSAWGKFFMRLITIFTLLSFQIEEPVLRLFILALGTITTMIDLCTSFTCQFPIHRSIVIWTLIASFFFFLSLRVYFMSLMAAWSSSTVNFSHFFLGLVVLVEEFFRNEMIWKLFPFNFSKRNFYSKFSDEVREEPKSLFVGLGFGGLLFILHWVFGEVSLISRWASNGYPDQAPDPIPYGLFVWIGLFSGLLIAHRSNIVQNRWWASLGFLSYLTLYYARGKVSFLAGLALSVFTGSILPFLFDKITARNSIRVFVIAAFFYIFQIVYAVWASAYNFVPFGGTLTRETSNILLVINFLGLYFGVYTAKQKSVSYVQTRIGNQKFPNGTIWSIFALSFLVAAYGTWSRSSFYPAVSSRQNENPTHVSAAIWTVHFGYDNNARPSLDRSVQALADTNADIIGLLETDTAKPFFGNNDLTSYLGEKLNMFTDFGPATKDHTWGCIILSKYPIVRSVHYLLPSPEGELAPAILATVQTAIRLVDVLVVHMGNDKDDLDRKLQAQTLRDIMKNSTNPLIFLGYVTSSPMSRDYLVLNSVAKDIDPTDRDRWCEYIFYKNLIRVGYARITHGGLTDTEIQMGKFQIPTTDQYKDNEKLVIDPNLVKDSSILFNSKFGSFYRGHGSFKTHRFHMDTPKYFLP